MANHDTASWTEGTILFGGSELHTVLAGSTADAAPVGLGRVLVDDERVIVFWEKSSPLIFQTVLEANYTDSENRVIVMEITGAASGEEVQIQARDASYGAADKLNSESFNKIVAGEFTTEAMTGVDTGGIPGAGVAFDSTGLHLYDGISTDYLMNLTGSDLRFYTSDVTQGKLSAIYSGSAVTYYNQSNFNALDADRLSQFSSTGLEFFGTNGTDTLSEFTTAGLSFFDNSANGYKLSMFNGSGAHIYDGTTATPGSANELVTLNAGGLELHDFATNDQGAGATLEFFAGATDSMGKLFAFQTGSGGINELHFTTATRTGDIAYNFVVGAQASNKVSYIKPLWDGYAYLGDPDNGERFKQLGVKEGIYIWGQAPSTPSFGGTTTQYMLYQNSGGLYWNGDPIGLSNVVTSSGSVPTSSYGTFRYDTDGGGSTADVLAFASGQTNATPAAATERSSFWTMLSEGDDTSNRLIFEPITTWSSASGFDNYSYIGWHNYIFSISSYYYYAGDGTAAFPSHTFYDDGNTGLYRISSGNIGISGDGTLRGQFGFHSQTIAPSSGGTTAYVSFSTLGNYGLWGASGPSYFNHVLPAIDDFYDLGGATLRFDDVRATNATIQTSDVRLKEKINPSTLGLDFVNDLNPISYKWKKKKENKLDQTHYGIIAQEVMETLKKYGVDSVEGFGGITHDGGEEDYYGARYAEFVPILIKAVQELSEEVKELKEKN